MTTNTLALRRVTVIVERVQNGTLTPATGLIQVEAYAAALDVEIYDHAVNAITENASEEQLTVPHRTASRRQQITDGTDARTRRTRKYERKTHASAARKGRYGAYGVESNVAERVTAASPGRERVTASPVRTLRPVWAVTPNVGTDDAALVLARPTVTMRPVWVIGLVADRTRRVESVPAEVTPTMASGKAVGITVPALTPAERRSGVTMRSLLALADDDAKAVEALAAQRYQRNGWAH